MVPIISVIVPAYLPTKDYFAFLDICVDSVKQQTYSNILLTIVYNGPFTKQYKNCNIIDLKVKTSAAIARNVGAAITNNADYFCFLDADDFFVSSKIEKQLNEMITNKIQFCFTEPININIDGSVRSEEYLYKNISSNEDIKNTLPQINCLPLSSSMIEKTSFFTCGMFPASIEYQICHANGHLNNKNATYEDYLLWISAINKNYNFKKLTEQLTYCRVGSTVER